MSVDQEVRTPTPSPSAEPSPASGGLVTLLAREVIPLGLLLLTFVVLARRAAAPLTNYDTFFHLRFGHEFVHGGWKPWAPGHISPLEHNDWVPTQWLSQVVMALTEDSFGLAGVAWLSGLLFITLAVALYAVARARTSLLPVAVLVPVAVIASLPSMTMRPQVISFTFAAVTVALWQRTRDTGRPPWLLVPLTWLWAMLHGMSPVGVVIGLAAAAGLVLDRRFDRRTAAQAFAVPLLSLATTLLTPVGPKLLSAVLLVSSRGSYFGEWSPPNFTSPPAFVLFLLLAFTTAMIVRQGNARWFDTLLLLTAMGWAVYSLRTVPVAAAMLVPLAAAAVDSFLPERTAPRPRERWVVYGGAVAVLGVLAAVVPHTAGSPLAEPAWVKQELGSLPPNEPVLADMTFGSYLMWRYPDIELAVHGYADVYSDQELKERVELEKVQPGWDDTIRSFGTTIALERPDAAITYALRLEGWSVVHANKDIVMLEAPDGWLTTPAS